MRSIENTSVSPETFAVFSEVIFGYMWKPNILLLSMQGHSVNYRLLKWTSLTFVITPQTRKYIFLIHFIFFLFRRVFLMAITLRTLGISFISLLCRNARKYHFLCLWTKRARQSNCSSRVSELDSFLCEIFLLRHLAMAYNIWCSILFGVPRCCLLQIGHGSLWEGSERAEMDSDRDCFIILD